MIRSPHLAAHVVMSPHLKQARRRGQRGHIADSMNLPAVCLTTQKARITLQENRVTLQKALITHSPKNYHKSSDYPRYR